jgi:hypothetical protein
MSSAKAEPWRLASWQSAQAELSIGSYSSS